MNKTLKFPAHFMDSIKSQEQITTTRLFDDKDLAVGDGIDLISNGGGTVFAHGVITAIELKPFRDMLEGTDDQEGLKKMYEQDYYHRSISPEEPVKYVTIQLTKN